MHPEDPYAPPTSALADPSPASAPLKTDRTLQKILTALLIYPALDIGLPAVLSFLSGRRPPVVVLMWPIAAALLACSVFMIWRVRNRLLLVALVPILFAIGFTQIAGTVPDNQLCTDVDPFLQIAPK
ncbi:hypothetical protein PQU14_16725 [Xanthomonas protegens]|uniref:hypothetical protein n=1 Tax=Xanthomonas protegens TaxID=3380705 RepID=UPI00313C5346